MRQDFSDGSSDGMERRPPEDGADGTLIHDRRLVARELLVAERLEAAERLGAWFAHQVNNPLGAISGSAQLLARRLQRDIKDPQALQIYLGYVDAIQSQIERCTRITGEVLNFTQPGAPEITRFDALAAVLDAAELVRYAHPTSVVFIQSDGVNLPMVKADREWLMRVVFEVLVNAVQASGTSVEVALRAEDGLLVIEITDHGPGMSPEVMDRAFDPFFSTHEKSRGLGLSIGLDMMRRMGGYIEARPGNPTGTVVAIGTPMSEERD